MCYEVQRNRDYLQWSPGIQQALCDLCRLESVTPDPLPANDGSHVDVAAVRYTAIVAGTSDLLNICSYQSCVFLSGSAKNGDPGKRYANAQQPNRAW